MRSFHDLPIRRKLTLITLIISGAALLLACAAFAFYEQNRFRQSNARDFAILADMFDDNVASGLAFNDPASIEQTLATLSANASIMAACVYDHGGAVVARYERPDHRGFNFPARRSTGQLLGSDRLDTFKTIVLAGEPIGVVYIGSDLRELRERAVRYVVIVAILLLGCSLVALLLVGPLQKLISQPIVELARIAANVAAGDFSRRAAKRGGDEVGRLVDAFNGMLSHIEARNTELQQARDQLEKRVEERTAELNLEKSRFKFIFDSVPIGFSWMLRGQLDSRIANPALGRISGVPTERCRELDLYHAATHPEDRPQQDRLHAALMAGEIGHYEMEKRYVHPDGTTRWAVLSVKHFHDHATGEVQEIRTTIDITERKRAEEELRWKTAFLEALVESPLFGLRVVDPTGKMIFQNQRTVELWKLPADVASDEDAQLHFLGQIERPAAFLGRLQNVGPAETTQDEIKLRDGTVIDRYSAPVVGKDGQCYGRIFAYQDITTRKQAEARLAETSALLQTLLENAPDLIYFKDLESRLVHYSGAFAPKFNFSDHHALRGKTDFDLYSDEHARVAFEDEQRIIRTGHPIVGKLEKETYTDGRVTWALTTKLAWRNAEGRIIGTFGISKDVTAIKEANARAVYERDLLQTLLDKLPDTIYFKDLQSRFVRVSRSQAEHARTFLRAKHALASEPLPAHLESADATAQWMIGRTDFETFDEGVARPALEEEQNVVRTGEPVVGRIERVLHPDGSVVWFLVNKMPWRDKDGNVVGTFGSSHNITAIKEAEAKLAETHKQLLEISRQAGMAEVATGVLHNVGNVLNSVNVSTTLIGDLVRQSKIDKVAKLAELLASQEQDLASFFQKDPRGQKVPGFLQALAAHLDQERADALKELDALRKNIEHIKEIVAMQQSYAKVSGICETIGIVELVEDALRMNSGALVRHDVSLVRDFQASPLVTVEKHKVLQILVNLMRNAKYACDDSGRTDKQMTLRIATAGSRVKIDVIDNGVGIPPENITRIFSHGFTTRKHGHGFGLHSCALAARELGGSLVAQSDGPGRGATFTLELPHQSEIRAA